MKPVTTEDILELMDGYIVSAALGTAMELGVFWLLAKKPLSATNVAQSLNIPLNRCHNWLQILCTLGLLENSTEGYFPLQPRRWFKLDCCKRVFGPFR